MTNLVFDGGRNRNKDLDKESGHRVFDVLVLHLQEVVTTLLQRTKKFSPLDYLTNFFLKESPNSVCLIVDIIVLPGSNFHASRKFNVRVF